MSNVLLFGATGALGSAILDELKSAGYNTISVSRSNNGGADLSLEDPNWATKAKAAGPISGIVWAQGVNAANTILTASREDLEQAMQANVYFIPETLRALVSNDCLAKNTRAVVLSSIWQEHARSNKFTYMVSKAALSGLISSAAIDLADIGISINAVLPGVIDTPMTRANLSASQIEAIESSTLGGELAKPADVAKAVKWLISEESRGVRSQFITVDNGWTINRHV